MPPFAAKTPRRSDFSVQAVEPGVVYLNVILQPRHATKHGAIAYAIRMRRIAGHWRIDWFTPTAFFAAAGQRPSVTAQPDFGPGTPSGYAPARIPERAAWGVVALLVCAPLLLILGFCAFLFARRLGQRRRSRANADDGWGEALRRARG